MEKRTENQAEEALRYVYECLCGHIKKPDEKDACTLIVPDDIADSFVKRDFFYNDLFYMENHPFNRTSVYLGEILWIWAYSENDAGTKTSDLQKYLDAVISEFYMLKPSAVTLEKNADGKYAYLSCTLAYGRDGIPTKILADTEQNFDRQLKQELDLLIEHHGDRKIKAMYEIMQFLNGEFGPEFIKDKIRSVKDDKILNPRIPKLNSIVIPDDLFDIMERNNSATCGNEEIEFWSVGTVKWITRTKCVPSTDSDKRHVSFTASSQWYQYNHAASELYAILRNILFEFQYLKPGPVTLEIDNNGQDAHLSCTIQYSSSGYPWRISEKTIEDFAFSMQLEAYKLLHDGECSRLEEAKLYAECCLSGLIPYSGPPEIIYEASPKNPKKKPWLRTTNLRLRFDDNETEPIDLFTADIIEMQPVDPEQFYMLKPGPKIIESNKKGVFLCCTIAYSRDGSEKKIKSRYGLDFQYRMVIERDKLMKYSFNLYSFQKTYPPVITEVYENSLKRISDLCQNTELHQAQPEDDRLDGRKPKKDFDYFKAVIESRVGKNKGRLFSTHESLAKECGFDSSYLSKIRKQKINPSPERALRLGIALQLSPDELEKFMNAAGYLFPAAKIDCIVLDILESGIRGYDAVFDKIYETDPVSADALFMK